MTLFCLLTFCFRAVAEDSYYGSYGSESGSTPTSKGPAGHFAIVADYSTYAVDYSTNGSKTQPGTGTGYAVGLELDSPSTTLLGYWILGVYYVNQSVQISPNSVSETDAFQAFESPILWGKSFGPHLVIGLGGLFRYDLNSINRTTATAKTTLNHQNFGLSTTQTDGVAFVRFYIRGLGKSQVFADFKYCVGLTDRAVGSTDKWKDSENYFGLGVMF